MAAEPEAPPRVLFVINGLPRGGAETQLLRIARETRERGATVAVACLRGENDFAEQVARDGLEVWTHPSPTAGWDPRYLARLAVRIVRWRPTVMVSFLFQATLFARLVRVAARPRRSIASMRNERLESRLRTVIYRATCGLDDLVVANSEAALRTLRTTRTVPRDPRRSVAVPNGVDVSGIRARATADPEQTRAALGVGPDDRLFVGVGRLSRQKDWETLIDATAHVSAELSIRCVVAGSGELEEPLRERIAARGLGGRFELLGLRDDVPDLLAAADCLVLSSHYEGTPNVVLEALAMGTPVIASDVGACREMVAPEDGEIVPVTDVLALSSALRRRSTAGGGRYGTIRPPSARVLALSWDVVGQRWADLIGLSGADRVARADRARGRPRPAALRASRRPRHPH